MTAILSLVITAAAFWLAQRPPTFFAIVRGGWAAWVGVVIVGWALALFGLLLKATITSIAHSLPEKLTMTPVGEEQVPEDLKTVAGELTALGLTRATPPLSIVLSQPAVMYGFVKDGDVVAASAFVIQPPGRPAVPSFDFVSRFDNQDGGLTTSPNPAGSVLPASPGSLRQTFPGAAPATLLDQHRQALAWLSAQGLRARTLTPADFEPFFQTAMQRQRAAFRRSPLSHALIAIWRTVRKTTPHLGPLKDQAIARTEIKRMLARLVFVVLTLAASAATPVAAAPEGQVTWAAHISLAPTWFDPAETPSIITPFMVLYALHDGLVKPMPGNR